MWPRPEGAALTTQPTTSRNAADRDAPCPPPLDPELAAVLEPIADRLPPGFPPEAIPEIRAGLVVPPPTDEDLGRGPSRSRSGRCRDRPGRRTSPCSCAGRYTSADRCRPSTTCTAGHDHRQQQDGRRRDARPVRGTGPRRGLRGVPPRPGAPAPRTGRGLLRRSGVDGREREGNRRRPGADRGGRGKRGWRTYRGTGPARQGPGRSRLFGQMLLCPMLDDRNDSCSARQMAGHGVWDRTANETAWGALLGDARGGPDVSPMPHRPARPICPACRPRSSTSVPRRPSGTRTSPMRPGSGRWAGAPNSMCGRAGSTVSTASPRRPRSPARHVRPGRTGCAGCSAPDASGAAPSGAGRAARPRA